MVPLPMRIANVEVQPKIFDNSLFSSNFDNTFPINIMIYDTIIIGGGAAGLQAALILGRLARSVLIYDNNMYRNSTISKMNAYLGYDGIAPNKFRAIALKELQKYNVGITYETVTDISKSGQYFIINGDIKCKSIILATGITDILPNIDNIYNFWGKSVFSCPICDAWESKNKIIGVYDNETLTEHLKSFSKHVTNYSIGSIIKLLGSNGQLEAVQLPNLSLRKCERFFITPKYHKYSDIVYKLGLATDKGNKIMYDKDFMVSPGIFVAGDMVTDLSLSICAASSGAQTAAKVNSWLN